MGQILKYSLYITLFAVFIACNPNVTDEDDVWGEKEEQLIIELIEEREELSISVEAMKLNYVYNLLGTYGPYTALIPSNTAWETYFQEKGISSVNDIEADLLEKIFEYHILPFERKTLEFENGLMDEKSDTTVNGDRLYIDMTGGLDQVKVNNKALITTANIEAWNGLLHIVDHVLDPPLVTVGDYLQQQERFTSFSQFLNKYGILDTLELLRMPIYPYDKNEFTLVAVKNEDMDKILLIEDSLIQIDAQYEEKMAIDPDYALNVRPDQAAQYAASFIVSGIEYTPNMYSSFKNTIAKVAYGDKVMKMKFKVEDGVIIVNNQSLLDEEKSDLIMKNGVIHEAVNAFEPLEKSPRNYIFTAYPQDKWNTNQGANKSNLSSNGYMGDETQGIVKLIPGIIGAKFWVDIPDVPAGDYRLTLIVKKQGSKAKIAVNGEVLIFPGTNEYGVYDFSYLIGNRGRVDVRDPNPCSSGGLFLYEVPTANFHLAEGNDVVSVSLEVTYLNASGMDFAISALILEPAVL